MIHAREDYQRIQDPAGLIPPDEPVFLLRAKDRTAPDAVDAWARLQYSGGNRAMASMAMTHAERMRAWQLEHGSQTADLPDEVARATGRMPDPAIAMADRFQRISERLTRAKPAGRYTATGAGMRTLLIETCAAILRGES